MDTVIAVLIHVCTTVVLFSAEEYSLPASKMIATGQKSKTLHKEELNMSETERRIKRNVEENARLQQKKRTVQQQQQSHGQSAKITTQRRENKVPLERTILEDNFRLHKQNLDWF
jgi:hypothetical protein